MEPTSDSASAKRLQRPRPLALSFVLIAGTMIAGQAIRFAPFGNRPGLEGFHKGVSEGAGFYAGLPPHSSIPPGVRLFGASYVDTVHLILRIDPAHYPLLPATRNSEALFHHF
jgi:hypothetical protein